MAQQILWCLSVVNRDTILCKAFGRTLSQRLPLEFWNKVMLSSGDNFSFKKQLLYCYRSLAEADHLTTDHQLTMWPKPPIMNYMWSLVHQTVKLGVHDSTPLSNRKSACKVLFKPVLKAQVSYMNPHVLCPRLLHYLLFFDMFLWSHSKVHVTSWLKKRNLGLVV